MAHRPFNHLASLGQVLILASTLSPFEAPYHSLGRRLCAPSSRNPSLAPLTRRREAIAVAHGGLWISSNIGAVNGDPVPTT
jgi:hypothetical protein